MDKLGYAGITFEIVIFRWKSVASGIRVSFHGQDNHMKKLKR